MNKSPEIDEILEKALEGVRLSKEDALALLSLTPDKVFDAGKVADRIRERKTGNYATYVVNRNINFTNICVGSCAFCAFRRDKNSNDAYFYPVEKIVEKAKDAEALGATEVCIQGGLHPGLKIDYYGDILKNIKEETSLHIHAFSPMEVLYASNNSGLDIKEGLRYLKEKGLDSMPGTAAEVLVDEIREEICPSKLSTKEWIDVIKTAHSLGIPSTATLLYGHIEENKDIVEHLNIIRDIQDKTGGFTEFVPLSFIHFKTDAFRNKNSRAGATGFEELRMYITSRLFLDNFDNLQVSWVKLGKKLSQLMLRFGANDLGGTLMEESISRSAGAEYEMLSVKEIERLIIDAGLEPRQRDTLYNIVR